MITQPKPYFITGIGTGIGKTLVSTILIEKFGWDYWKPIQSGDLENSDTLSVQTLLSNNTTNFHPETYRLTQPYSPHKSARIDGITIDLNNFKLPQTDNQLLIEGAGGLMVPLNEHSLIIDLIQQLNADVILVSQNYLGSINHTLLSFEILKKRNIPVKGIIFNGAADPSTEEFILNYTNTPCLGKIPILEPVNKESIQSAGKFIIEF
ncbi:dethiobiotin synthase [Solitalea longa]|uniref:ATP-dependent dethiobiotin synthetase BioD n=1 Tax=Solitalea longa TaxID=2079460 RepID=A0A2S5A4Q5_9SPHI|nr:dethiobiotin synthase [Solitalea longa]POY37525.1 dethiobiotin synthase [Solitalea longa]